MREALDGAQELLIDDDRDILVAIASLTTDARPTASLVAVASLCGWSKGRRITLGLRRLRSKGLIYLEPGVRNSIHLTREGYHAIDRLSPAEEQWQDGYATGRAAVMAEMSTSITDSAPLYPNVAYAAQKPSNARN